MEQTVIQVGNSIGVVIPARLRSGLKAGDKVIVAGDPRAITISPLKETLAGGVDAKFMQMVDSFITEHEDVLKELAKR